ncbi:DNA-binding XRE family transcriptional regulator [Thermosporothrix hazakensis]|jgi:transcriptional regulator with XRE-family HTH domain|uniref:DNA-binding XRE family transcriptional regulator n=1 Tax=Thermosporothrix hazakensis TaxID=644383 RepID=A0A326UBA3_THEHA|nr:helix-turn-helix transcriptional regulator [Thermosporothrix hazakensis]PZW25341.1 DNA-binding XRE family transcriptional regulator [Thermosporothrix hazakensis]GCE50571.1 hypothetical protein KTH_54400 [Thermosporothrix hazakensis]
MSQMSRYGKYSPGKYGFPHMGEVIADYRQRAGYSQEEFAIVCGVEKPTVVYWERMEYLADMDRRIFLCKLLGIAPALLGLNWRNLVGESQKETLDYIASFEALAEQCKENTYGIYEDYLTISYTSPYKFTPIYAYRLFKHQQDLENFAKTAPASEVDSWKDLLSRYYQFSSLIAQHHEKREQALALATEAVELAENLDADRICTALYRLARVYLIQERYTMAKSVIDEAISKYGKNVRISLKGNMYLLAAEINTLFAGNSPKQRGICRNWQSQALTIVHKGGLEEDETFLHFNLYAVHHERAKTLSRFSLFHTSNSELVELLKNPYKRADRKTLSEAEDALNLARKHISTSKHTRFMHYTLTESRMRLIGKELEESARSANNALKIAREINSNQGIKDVEIIYSMLSDIEPNNPYVRHLGVKLGYFPPLLQKRSGTV